MKERNLSLDVIRGLAVLGMIFINILVFIPNINEVIWHDYLTGENTSNELLYQINYMFFNGKMRALFALLFGAGIILFFQSENQTNRSDLFSRRMLWLLLFGLFHAYFLFWPGSILFEYACCGLLIVSLRKLRPIKLLTLSLITLGFYSYLNTSDYSSSIDEYNAYQRSREMEKKGQTVPKHLLIKKEQFENYLAQFPPLSISKKEELKATREEQLSKFSSGFMKFYSQNVRSANESLSLGVYLNILESIGTMLLGMFLLKVGFFESRFKKSIYALISIAFISTGLIIYYFLYQWQGNTQHQILLNYSEGNFLSFGLEQLGRILVCLGYCSVLILLCSIKTVKPIMILMANVGRMAFTNYILQTVICVIIFYILEYYGTLSFYAITYICIAIIILQLFISQLIIKNFKVGPLEYVWRKLTFAMVNQNE